MSPRIRSAAKLLLSRAARAVTRAAQSGEVRVRSSAACMSSRARSPHRSPGAQKAPFAGVNAGARGSTEPKVPGSNPGGRASSEWAFALLLGGFRVKDGPSATSRPGSLRAGWGRGFRAVRSLLVPLTVERLAAAMWDAREAKEPSGERTGVTGDDHSRDPVFWAEAVREGLWPGSLWEQREEAFIVGAILGLWDEDARTPR